MHSFSNKHIKILALNKINMIICQSEPVYPEPVEGKTTYKTALRQAQCDRLYI